MSQRKTAVAVGILFFVQMITYMIGAQSLQTFEDGDTAAPPPNASHGMRSVSRKRAHVSASPPCSSHDVEYTPP